MNYKSAFTATLVLALVAALAASPLRAESHSFQLRGGGSINGTELEPGDYKLELNGQGEVLIYRGGRMVAKAPAEVAPLKNNTINNSVLKATDGSVLEIRLKKEVVVIGRPATGASGSQPERGR